jgi:prolyl-tRNA editing enzyme YbaK/EbsC (Cys-tRNA(Pro) deacylase)
MSSASAVLTSPSVERVRHALERAGLDTEIVELPGAARTAKAAAEFLGCEVAQIANSLVFRAEASDSPVLVMSSGARRVDTARLSTLVGEAVGKADADFVRKHTGFAAGHPHTVFRLTYADLVRVTGGTQAELAT